MHWPEDFRVSLLVGDNWLTRKSSKRHIRKIKWFHSFNQWDNLFSFSNHTILHHQNNLLVNDHESWAWMVLWTLKNLESKSWGFLDEYREKVKEMLFLVHKKWDRRSKNRFLCALRASNWLYMVVCVLIEMTILQILDENEDERVKNLFSKKWYFCK